MMPSVRIGRRVRAMLGEQAVGAAQIAKDTGLTRQTVYRIKGAPAGAEAALGVWGCEYAMQHWRPGPTISMVCRQAELLPWNGSRQAVKLSV